MVAMAEQRHRDREVEMAREDPRLRNEILAAALRRAGELGLDVDAAALLRMQALLAPRGTRPRSPGVRRRKPRPPYAAQRDAIQGD